MEATAESAETVGRNHIIERPRLTRLLDETSARVIMLGAPAGYGKTTLARQWLASRTHAWYQAGAASSDVAALALGIADTASDLCPGAGRRLREWLPTSREPEKEVEVIAELLAADLEPWPEDAWFVIDDYQLLSSEPSERLTAMLFSDAERRLLATSRSRPSWSTARDLLYGVFFELGQSALAMTMDEASSVLASGTGNTGIAGGLTTLADGWPAVIGLAALAPSPAQLGDRLPDGLYDYFAEEFFASLSEDVQEGLSQLALIPTLTRAAAVAVVGERASQVLVAGGCAGVLAETPDQTYALHPLLRAFLVQKLRLAPSALAELVERVVRQLINSGEWDDAFSLIRDFGAPELFDLLASRALVPLIDQGRIATIEEWVDFAHRRHLTSQHVDLAEGELCFRRGRTKRAHVLAERAAGSLDTATPLRSLAEHRAGQSAYLLDRTVEALEHFERAREYATTPTDRRNALWGEFTACVELEYPDATERLQQFAAVGPPDVESALRLVNGNLILGARIGGLEDAIAEANEVESLVERACDPIVRSAYLHIYAFSLTLAAKYERSLCAVTSALAEIRASGFELALPHILLTHAAASIGLRRYVQANETLRSVESLASERRDGYLSFNAKVYRCRLLLETGQPDAALAAMSSGVASHSPSRGMRAEFLAMQAAAIGASGEPRDGLSLIESARALSTYLQPHLLSTWSRLICLFRLGDPRIPREVKEAFQQTTSAGLLDPFVFAYRVEPRILDVLLRDVDCRASVKSILKGAKDERQLGSGARRRLASSSGLAELTTREQEVHRLLAEGRTNREIGEILFISEATAKIHVRNILKKLEVRNRTEAALLAPSTFDPATLASAQERDDIARD
jgi:ATP/maltotriose-dependent transcriptional regulator MalT